MTPGPATDFFGTRLEPRELLDGLRALGLSRFSLTLRDHAVVLRVRDGEEAEPRAAVWLAGKFSPFLPCRVERVPAARARRLDGGFADRRGPALLVALTEVFDEKRIPSAEAGLRARLKALGARGAELRCRNWRRPGGAAGVRAATIVAASFEPEALAWLDAALADDTENAPAPPRPVLLDGLEWGVARRPTLAAPAAAVPIVVDAERCSSCGLCAKVCPADSLTRRGTFRKGGAERCLSCFDCVEACPQDALRPAYSASSATTSRALARRPGWLARLRGAAGPVLPAPFPPSYLLPKPGRSSRPRRVLGLAVATSQEHAAALVEGGTLAGAVEEERLSRVRHHGWSDRARPGSTVVSDPTLCLEEVLCRRAAGALLSPRGLTLDDMDLFAVNGLPARYRRAFSPLDARTPLPVLRAGRVVFVPHHLCHAASAWRLSGQKESLVLTVDGRGDRETAAIFRGARGRLTPLSSVLSLDDRSIGGVYETVSRLLGFGPHGQGSVMALAAFGRASAKLAPFLSWKAGSPSIRERGLLERFARAARAPGAPPARAQKELAASLQDALERTLAGLLADAGLEPGAPGLCLAGGVALNCRANAVLRRRFRPRALFVQPAANDAGTAAGAALEAAGASGLLRSAALGPDFSDSEAEAALRHAGLPYHRSTDVAAETADLLAAGKVVCWVQGRLEFGPRALGGRSLLADPRTAAMKDRVNRIKDREPWRPFGPSILAGREKDWLLDADDAPFMVVSARVKPSRAPLIPAVVHADGTTRPQSVHRETQPLYHALLSEFERRSGVPMLLNTSLNRRGEPLAASPADAARCFLGMPDADVLVAGPFVARRPLSPAPAEDSDRRLASLPVGRRLLLRLTARCDTACAYCSIRDLAALPDRSYEDAVRALADGRRAGCSELVLMRGEAALWPGLPHLLRRARAMGYAFVQLQTSGSPLAQEADRRELLPLLDALEVTVYSADEATHDGLARARGALRRTLRGARAAVEAGREVLVNVPVLRANAAGLEAVASLAAKLGARRVQFVFPRPVETAAGVDSPALARLADVSPRIRAALRAAAAAGVDASTEAVPFCHLDPDQRTGPDVEEDWRRFRVDDLDRLQESLDPGRAGTRPEAPPCRACSARAACPRAWASYLALFGSGELSPLREERPRST